MGSFDGCGRVKPIDGEEPHSLLSYKRAKVPCNPSPRGVTYAVPKWTEWSRTGSSVKPRLGSVMSLDRKGNAGYVVKHSGPTGFGC